MNNTVNKERRLVIEQSHKEGVETAADFCGVKNYKAKDLNYSNRVVHFGEERFDIDIQLLTDMALPQNPFKDKQIISEDDPIRALLEEKLQNQSSTKVEIEFDNKIKSKMNNCTS